MCIRDRLDEQQNLLYHTYERHYSHIVEKAAEVLAQADEAFVKGAAADVYKRQEYRCTCCPASAETAR